VKIDLINDTKLKVSLIENDMELKSMEFEGKIIDEYFSIKKKLLLIPIPFFTLHRERQTIIGNNDKSDLILTRGYYNAAWFVVMAADNGGISSYDFERKKN